METKKVLNGYLNFILQFELFLTIKDNLYCSTLIVLTSFIIQMLCLDSKLAVH